MKVLLSLVAVMAAAAAGETPAAGEGVPAGIGSTTEYRIPVTSEASPLIDSAEWSGGCYSTRIGIFSHIAGRGKGQFTFRVKRRESQPVRGVAVTARVSSDFPGSACPPDGYSDVTCTVNSVRLGTLRVVRDNFRGRSTTWSAEAPQGGAFGGEWLTVTLSVEDDAAMANGLCIYSPHVSYERCATSPIREDERTPTTVTLYHASAPPAFKQAPPDDDPDYVDWSQHRKTVSLKNPVDGTSQKATVYLPRQYDARNPCALIVHHHSHGGHHDDVATMGLWHPLASSCNCIIVSGDLHGNAWGNDLSMADLDQMVKHVVENWSVDASRVYGHGNSMGGAIAVHMGRNPDLYAAGVIVHGVLDLRRFHAEMSARPEKPFIRNLEQSMEGPPSRAYDEHSGISYAASFAGIPMLFYHGEADTIVTPDHSTAMAEAIESRGGHARVVMVPQWGHAYQIADELDFMAFLLEQRNPRPREMRSARPEPAPAPAGGER